MQGQVETDALRDVNFSVYEGEFVAIVGASGSGKSTLLNILGLLDGPTAGTYELDGVDTGPMSESERDVVRSRKIGFVFQDAHVLPQETAAENASLGLKIQGQTLAARRHAVGEVLNVIGMAHRASTLGKNLSGGERQRVAIARAIATNPRVVLADEPTGSLDKVNSELVVDHLRKLAQSGTTVIVITHDSAVAAAADRQLVLDDGVLAESERGGPDVSPGNLKQARTERLRDDSGRRRVSRLLRGAFSDATDALSSHTAQPGRAALLLLAFVLGTGGLVCAVGISQGAGEQVSERVAAAALDEIVVRSVGDSDLSDFYVGDSTNSPSARIHALPGVESVGMLAGVDAKVSRLAEPAVSADVRVFSANADYLIAEGATVSPASSGPLLSAPWGEGVAIIGREAADRLGVEIAAPGIVIHVAGRPVDVVGVLSDVGRDPLLSEAVILSPAAAAGHRITDPQLIVRTKPGYAAPLAEAIPRAVDPGNPEGVRLETVADLRILGKAVSGDLGTLIGAVSLLLLFLACMTSASAMHLTVLARTREIALRRAIGASRSSIRRLFTFEGIMIGMVGGLSGVAVGSWALIAISGSLGWAPTLDPRVSLLAVVAGACTGGLSALYPSAIAARIDPSQAIRS